MGDLYPNNTESSQPDYEEEKQTLVYVFAGDGGIGVFDGALRTKQRPRRIV